LAESCQMQESEPPFAKILAPLFFNYSMIYLIL
jgi:hypothetical protein